MGRTIYKSVRLYSHSKRYETKPQKGTSNINMMPPTNLKQLRSFIRAVNYYQDMWPQHAHLLSKLTSLTGQTSFQWSEEHQKAFNILQSQLLLDAMVCYPNPNIH